MIELKRCPFCGGPAWLVKLADGEGYAISHTINDEIGPSADCPIALGPDDGETIGVWCWDMAEEAAAAWNRRVPDMTEDDLK